MHAAIERTLGGQSQTRGRHGRGREALREALRPYEETRFCQEGDVAAGSAPVSREGWSCVQLGVGSSSRAAGTRPRTGLAQACGRSLAQSISPPAPGSRLENVARFGQLWVKREKIRAALMRSRAKSLAETRQWWAEGVRTERAQCQAAAHTCRPGPSPPTASWS